MDEWDLRALAAAIRPELPALLGPEEAARLDALLAEALDRTPGRAKGVLRNLLLSFTAPAPVRDWARTRLPARPDTFRTYRVIDPWSPDVPLEGNDDHLTLASPDPGSWGYPPDRWAGVDQQVLSFAITELGPEPGTPLVAGRDYTAVFRAGPEPGNSLFGLGPAVLDRVPSGGLDTRWVVASRTARLSPAAPADPRVEVATAEAGRDQQWMATFPLHIPQSGDSARRRVRLTPLDVPESRVDVLVYAGDDLYRQLTVSLTVRPAGAAGPGGSPDGDGGLMLAVAPFPAAGAEAAAFPGEAGGTGRVAEVLSERLLPAAHTGLRTPHEWQAPARQLNIHVTKQSAIVSCDATGLDDEVDWSPGQGDVEAAIAAVRTALDRVRDEFPQYWDLIDADGLLPALSSYTPSPHWLPAARPATSGAPGPASASAWEKVAASKELRDLAFWGNQLYQATFGQDVRDLIEQTLSPGDMLRLNWRTGTTSWVPQLPLALMCLRPPRAGQLVDPGDFLGLRYRLGYQLRRTAPSSRALGDWARTTRAHLIYWGGGPSDPLATEAGRHRQELATWADGLRLLPDRVALGNGTASALWLAEYLENPVPSPVSVLYLYCHCRDGGGISPVLRFGPATGPASELEVPDIGGMPLADAPVVFVNACASGASQPLLANQLTGLFFRRGCRAYIGTEAKVPAALAARFATAFFSFLYGDAGRGIAPVGEAIAQARRFLWTEYQSIGGLFYTYVNDYALYAADESTVASLRRPT